MKRGMEIERERKTWKWKEGDRQTDRETERHRDIET
jgi:hypothetical protein